MSNEEIKARIKGRIDTFFLNEEKKRAAKAAPKKKNRNLETPIIDAIKKVSVLVGVKLWRVNSSAVYSVSAKRYLRSMNEAGLPDLMGVCLLTGKAVFVEVKGEGDTLKEHQREILDIVSSSGGIAFVARSADDFMRQLSEKRGSREILSYERTER